VKRRVPIRGGSIITLLLLMASTTAVPAKCIDQDHDLYGIGCPAGPDCNDNDSTVHPGAYEPCGVIDGIDQDCDGRVDQLIPDRVGTPFCIEYEPITAWVDQTATVSVHAYYQSGINSLFLYRDDRFPAIATQSCAGALTCTLTTTITQAFEAQTLLNTAITNGTSAEQVKTLGFNCPREYCPPDLLAADAIRWMRSNGYMECVVAKFAGWTIAATDRVVVRKLLELRPTDPLAPTKLVDPLHFWDIIPDWTDPQATSKDLGGSLSEPCQFNSIWPDWCPTPEPADWQFLKRHMDRTFGVNLGMYYHQMLLDYDGTFGTPVLANGCYRFNVPQSWYAQFSPHVIIHWAVQTWQGVPMCDMTGSTGTNGVAFVNTEPYNVNGTLPYTHEWGHTWGLSHNWLGVFPPPYVSIDGVMDNTYRTSQIPNLIDPTDPWERYGLGPISYRDETTFGPDYSSKVIGSPDLPTCGSVDPAIRSGSISSQTATTVTVSLTLKNFGTAAASYVKLGAYDGSSGPLIEERVIGQLAAGEQRTHAFTVPKASVAGGQIFFVFDAPGEVLESNEGNNSLTVRLR
jgi:hypothetical protein